MTTSTSATHSHKPSTADAMKHDAKVAPAHTAHEASAHEASAHEASAHGASHPSHATHARVHDHLLKKGDSGRAVSKMQHGLKGLGYATGAEGKYDDKTAHAVAQFKHDEGLKKAHGDSMSVGRQHLVRRELHTLDHAPLHERVKKMHPRLDAATKNQAERPGGIGGMQPTAMMTPQEKKAHANAVKNVKAHLESAGYHTKSKGGDFDARTEGAVKAFQKKSGLPPTGTVDGDTWRQLQRSQFHDNRPEALREKSGQVIHTEKALQKAGYKHVNADGVFDKRTQNAVKSFEKKHHLKVDGNVSASEEKKIEKAAKGTSAQGKREMHALENTARANSEGRSPDGYCLKHVQDFLASTKYGRAGSIPRLPEAHDFADLLNSGHNAAKYGLKRLHISNPYDAPPGSIVVVAAGSPGTSNPTAGDITVRGHGDHFYNGGEMGYGPKSSFKRDGGHVLGVYVPS